MAHGFREFTAPPGEQPTRPLEVNRSWGSIFMRILPSGLTYAESLSKAFGGRKNWHVEPVTPDWRVVNIVLKPGAYYYLAAQEALGPGQNSERIGL